jgi:hypothetical protein
LKLASRLTPKEEPPTKHLRVDSEKGQYSVDGTNWTDIDKIGKADLLRLMDLALRDDFEMDPYDKAKLANPAHEIVYRNLFSKLAELVTKKDRFKDESLRLYADALRKYRSP